MPALRLPRATLVALCAAALPALAFANDRMVEDRVNHNRGDSRYERDLRMMQAYERQKKIEAFEASQGGRSGPNAIGPEPYKNPRPVQKPVGEAAPAPRR